MAKKTPMLLPITADERSLVYRWLMADMLRKDRKNTAIGAVFDKLPGGRGFGMMMLSLAAGEDNEVGRKLLQVCKQWNKLPRWKQDKCLIDDLVIEAGLTPGEAIGAAARHTKNALVDATSMMVYAFSPDAVVTMGKQAKKPGGIRDRENLLQAAGVLPVPKGATVAIQNNLGMGISVGSDVDDSVPSLPDFEGQTVEASRIVREEP